MKRTKEIAREISNILPAYLRHVLPAVLHSIELPPSQVIALVALYQKKSCSLGDLSKEMHVSAPTVTGIVDRLEKGGCIKRVSDPNDRRVTKVEMTKKGQDTVQKFLSNVREKWEVILDQLPLRDQESWLRIFKSITEGLSKNAG